MIEQIAHNTLDLATIIRSSFKEDGIKFFTGDEAPLQIGYMQREQNYTIRPHVHNSVERRIESTHEVLFIKSGKIRIDFYSDEQKYIKSTVVSQGDVILLAEGGHGFKMLETSEIIEVKQGPYAGENDKVRFDSVPDHKVVMM